MQVQTIRSHQHAGARIAQLKKMGIPHGRGRGAHRGQWCPASGKGSWCICCGTPSVSSKAPHALITQEPSLSRRICASKTCVHSSTMLPSPSAGQTKSPARAEKSLWWSSTGGYKGSTSHGWITAPCSRMRSFPTSHITFTARNPTHTVWFQVV